MPELLRQLFSATETQPLSVYAEVFGHTPISPATIYQLVAFFTLVVFLSGITTAILRPASRGDAVMASIITTFAYSITGLLLYGMLTSPKGQIMLLLLTVATITTFASFLLGLLLMKISSKLTKK